MKMFVAVQISILLHLVCLAQSFSEQEYLDENTAIMTKPLMDENWKQNPECDQTNFVVTCPKLLESSIKVSLKWRRWRVGARGPSAGYEYETGAKNVLECIRDSTYRNASAISYNHKTTHCMYHLTDMLYPPYSLILEPEWEIWAPEHRVMNRELKTINSLDDLGGFSWADTRVNRTGVYMEVMVDQYMTDFDFWIGTDNQLRYQLRFDTGSQHPYFKIFSYGTSVPDSPVTITGPLTTVQKDKIFSLFFFSMYNLGEQTINVAVNGIHFHTYEFSMGGWNVRHFNDFSINGAKFIYQYKAHTTPMLGRFSLGAIFRQVRSALIGDEPIFTPQTEIPGSNPALFVSSSTRSGFVRRAVNLEYYQQTKFIDVNGFEQGLFYIYMYDDVQVVDSIKYIPINNTNCYGKWLDLSTVLTGNFQTVKECVTECNKDPDCESVAWKVGACTLQKYLPRDRLVSSDLNNGYTMYAKQNVLTTAPLSMQPYIQTIELSPKGARFNKINCYFELADYSRGDQMKIDFMMSTDENQVPFQVVFDYKRNTMVYNRVIHGNTYPQRNTRHASSPLPHGQTRSTTFNMQLLFNARYANVYYNGVPSFKELMKYDADKLKYVRFTNVSVLYWNCGEGSKISTAIPVEKPFGVQIVPDMQSMKFDDFKIV